MGFLTDKVLAIAGGAASILLAFLLAGTTLQNMGLKHQIASYAKAETKAEVHTAVVVAQRQDASNAIETKAVETVEKVRTNTVYLTKEIPDAIPAVADAACVVPVGFVRLHDAAASGLPSVPSPAGLPDESPSGVQLSAVEQTVIANYGAGHETSEQLTALQDWVRKMQATK